MTDISREEWNSLVKSVTRMETTLVGLEGEEEGGLCGEVKRLAVCQNKLKDNFRLLVGILVGSGVIGGGTAGILKLIGA